MTFYYKNLTHITSPSSPSLQKPAEPSPKTKPQKSVVMAASSSSSIKPIFTTPSKSTNSSKSSLLSFLHNTNPKPISLKLYSHNSYYTPSPSFTIRNSLKTALETSDRPVSKFQDDINVQTVTPKPTILVSEKLGEAGLAVLRSFGNVECLYDLSPEALCEKISQFDALIVRSGTKVTRSIFEAANGKLKVVGRAGVGIDNVDLQAATEFGCLVVNAPTANTVAAAEHGIALLASMARNVSQADASIKAGNNGIHADKIFTFKSIFYYII